MYEKQVWEDREVERPLTYRAQNNADGTITLTPVTGEVFAEGNIATAERMNHIESGIATNDSAIAGIVDSMIQPEYTVTKFANGTMIQSGRTSVGLGTFPITTPVGGRYRALCFNSICW